MTEEEKKKLYQEIEYFQKALRINPNKAEGWLVLGILFYLLERHNDSIEPYRQALRINPELAEAWYYLGLAYGHLDRHYDAIEAFRQALRIGPYADSWLALGDTTPFPATRLPPWM